MNPLQRAPEETIKNAYIPIKQILSYKERLKLDREATAEAQVKLLRKARFVHAGCPYKYFKFVVIFGTKK